MRLAYFLGPRYHFVVGKCLVENERYLPALVMLRLVACIYLWTAATIPGLVF